MKISTVSIGIPALNEEKSIGRLLSDLLAQKETSIKIKEILVASDGSTDRTVEIVKKLAVDYSKIKLLNFENRLGRAARQNQLMEKSTGDVFVLLDGDIHITDKSFIKKLVMPIINGTADLTSSALVELKPRTFFEKSLYISMKLKNILFDSIKNGNNVYTCHGPARAFSRSLYKEMVFPSSDGEDMYSYFYCLYTGRIFLYAKKAEVKYRLPDNYKDHKKQSVRYHNSKRKYLEQFDPTFIRHELAVKPLELLKAVIRSLPVLIRYPHHVLQYIAVLSYLKLSKTLVLHDLNHDNWQVSSSKS